MSNLGKWALRRQKGIIVCDTVMSFYHVLPSNVAPETYPKNSASSFMTPLTVPYNLNGKWQVALTSINYSGCVNTFLDTDTVKVTHKFDSTEDVKKVKRPIRMDLPKEAKTYMQIAKMITKALPGILKVEHYFLPVYGNKSKDYFKWVGLSDEHVIVICPKLASLFKLRHNAITSYDNAPENFTPFPNSNMLKKPLASEHLKDLFLTIVPIPDNARKIVIKEVNEELTPEEVIQRVNSRVPNVELTLATTEKHFNLTKTSDDTMFLLLSKDLNKCMGFSRAGMDHGLLGRSPRAPGSLLRYWEYDFDRQFSKEWSMTVFDIKGTVNVKDDYEWIYPLKSISFQQHASALDYLNTLTSEVQFKLSKENKLSLELKREDMKVSFSSDLRDCLAFDKSDLIGKGTHFATGTFSLKRRISYLYIYSNVGEYCKVGDTQTPLLGVVPFEGKACETVQERIFRNPMYVPVRANHMSYIEVLLCDGTGQTVPFTLDGKSVICLHFKQV